MNQHQLFSGRAFNFHINKKLDKDDVSAELLDKLTKSINFDLSLDEIVNIGGNESFDEFKITSYDKLYSLKISLDKDCKFLNNEISFLKNNDSALTNKHIDSGVKKIGVDVLYLLSSFEDGDDCNSLGRRYFIDNSVSFLFTLKQISKLKSNSSFDEYLDLFFNEYSVIHGSDFLKNNISSFYNIDDIEFIFKEIEEEARLLYSSVDNKNDQTCHGNLNYLNVITRYGLFKFKNFNFCFLGNKFFDFCFFVISLGLSKVNVILFYKKYCSFFDLDEKQNYKEFDHMMKLCSALYLCKTFFDFLIEEIIFANARPQNTLNLIYNYSSSSKFFKNLECFSAIEDKIDKIVVRPVIGEK